MRDGDGCREDSLRLVERTGGTAVSTNVITHDGTDETQPSMDWCAPTSIAAAWSRSLTHLQVSPALVVLQEQAVAGV